MESLLKRVVDERRELILERWTERVLASYPKDSGRLLRETRDPFRNPVGSSIAAAVGPLLDAVTTGAPDEAAFAALDTILRVRAVQELGPADALRFLLELRGIVRHELERIADDDRREALARLDRNVDEMVLAGFEVYVRCREEIWRIRTDEIRRRSTKVLERLDLWRTIRDGGDAGDR